MRAHLLRVSTDEQKENETIIVQRDYLRGLSGLEKKEFKEYVDDGVSGTTPLEERPGGRQLVEDIKHGLIDEVLVYRLDRIGRKVRVVLDVLKILDDNHISLRSATEPIDTANAFFGKMMIYLLAMMAEWELDTIRDRMESGKLRKVKEGQFKQGKLPFGYARGENDEVVVNEELIMGSDFSPASLVRFIFESIVNGMSVTALCQKLVLMRIPPEARRGKTLMWHPGPVQYIIHNPSYYGEHQTTVKQQKLTVNVPAIVSKEVWDKANSQLHHNKKCSPRNRTHEYLLHGMIRCGECGSPMYGHYVGPNPKTRNYRHKLYYRCNTSFGRARNPLYERTCKMKYIDAELLDKAVWDEVGRISTDPQVYVNKIMGRWTERRVAFGKMREEREQITKILLDKEKERQRILLMTQKNFFSLEEAEDRLRTVEAELAQIRMNLANFDNQEQLIHSFEAYVLNLKQMLEDIRQHHASADFERKRQDVSKLFARVVVHYDETGFDPQLISRFNGTESLDIENSYPPVSVYKDNALVLERLFGLPLAYPTKNKMAGA